MPALVPIRFGSSPEGTPKRPLTTGVSAVIPQVPTTWNPADLSNVMLSSGNLVSTVGIGNGGVRGIAGAASGKYYMEFKYNVINTNSVDTGIALSSGSLVGASGIGIALIARASGLVQINGAPVGTPLGIIAPSDVIGIAIDLTAQLIWFRIAPVGNWNADALADPATGAGGLSIATISFGLLYPYMTGNTGDKITANFGGSAFSGAVPAGFVSGWL